MTASTQILKQSGYSLPQSWEKAPSPPRSTSPDEERIPFPYCYTEIIMPEEEKKAYRERFVQECNMRRWQHIYNSQAYVKK